MAEKKGQVIGLGVDVSTGTFGLAALIEGLNGELTEEYVSIDMLGATLWNEQPAFDLDYIPKMFLGCLQQLLQKGYTFAFKGYISGACRQHGSAILDKSNNFLAPELSWQCNWAVKETEKFREAGFEDIVGRLEPRLLLTKLSKLLSFRPEIRDQIHLIMTTGDSILYNLTGIPHIGSSEAVSNGLVLLGTEPKQKANAVIASAGFDTKWFPKIISSGTEVGVVRKLSDPTSPWYEICSLLSGWLASAGVGDNHGQAVGCGLRDLITMVLSFGNSGTLTRLLEAASSLSSEAMRFEYFKQSLALLMMPDCAAWFDLIVDQLRGNVPRDSFMRDYDKDALAIPVRNLRLIQKHKTYPAEFRDSDLVKYTNAQYSITIEMLRLACVMQKAVTTPGAPAIEHWVITGGLSKGPVIRKMIKEFSVILGGPELFESAKTGPLKTRTTGLGALVTALWGGGYFKSLDEAIEALCPVKPFEV